MIRFATGVVWVAWGLGLALVVPLREPSPGHWEAAPAPVSAE